MEDTKESREAEGCNEGLTKRGCLINEATFFCVEKRHSDCTNPSECGIM